MSTSLNQIQNNSLRRRMQKEAEDARKSFTLWGLRVDDFTHEELLASMLALSEAAERSGMDPVPYLAYHLDAIRQASKEGPGYGERRFFGYLQRVLREGQKG